MQVGHHDTDGEGNGCEREGLTAGIQHPHPDQGHQTNVDGKYWNSCHERQITHCKTLEFPESLCLQCILLHLFPLPLCLFLLFNTNPPFLFFRYSLGVCLMLLKQISKIQLICSTPT